MLGKRGRGEGGIDERSSGHYRLRWRVGGTRYSKAFRGTLSEARKELRRLLKSADDGQHVAPDNLNVADYLRAWIAGDTGISPKTRERYQQLAERQIITHLGTTALQKLRPAQISDWHVALLATGLASRTIGHAHRVLHRGLERAVALELVTRNAAHAVPPPKVEAAEVAILSPEQVDEVRDKLAGHSLATIFELGLGTGMRRGEICGLVWGALDIDRATVRVECSIEETAAGLRRKEPKTLHGRRSISLPPTTVAALREHQRQQLEIRVKQGLGRPSDNDYVFTIFAEDKFSPYPPDKLSRDWGNAVRDRGLPRIMFHALRHTHASALIAGGLDAVAVSRRLGHGSPAITLAVYAHLFHRDGDLALRALEKAFGSGTGSKP